MNKLGSAGAPVAGSLLRPDPPEETAALAKARAAQHGHGAELESASGPTETGTTIATTDQDPTKKIGPS
jgi:ubiquinol-cytochrome c reductase cytochrome b subunit